MKVNEIRTRLIATGKYSTEEANSIKGKENLLNELNKALSESGEDNVSFEEDFVIEQQEMEQPISEQMEPKYTDASWNDYIMSLFTEDELIKGRPNVDGLRRVTEDVLGEIISSRPVECRSETDYAMVRWELIIAWKQDIPLHLDITRHDLPTKVFGACADAHYSNTKSPYSNYLASFADTRAESKCLRRALRLRTIAAEEVNEEEITENEGVIKGGQKLMMSNMCEKLDIDEKKFLSSKGFELETMSYEDARSSILALRSYIQDISTIPETIRRTK